MQIPSFQDHRQIDTGICADRQCFTWIPVRSDPEERALCRSLAVQLAALFPENPGENLQNNAKIGGNVKK